MFQFVQAGDRPGVVEGRAGVADLGLEAELILDVRHAIAVVVDVDLVHDIIGESVEVRSTLRGFERDEVGDQRDRILPVRTDERVDIGVIRVGVLAGQRRFTVAGRPSTHRGQHEQEPHNA